MSVHIREGLAVSRIKEDGKIVQHLTKVLSELTDAGYSPWEKGYSEYFKLCYSAATNHVYSGLNQFILMMTASCIQAQTGLYDPRWVTYNGAKKKGWQVKKGSRGTPILRPITIDIKDENGEIKLTKDGKPVKRTIFKTLTVFNATQIEGIPPYNGETVFSKNEENLPENIDRLLKDGRIKIRRAPLMGPAHYSLTTDTITVHMEGQYLDTNHAVTTILHEVGHWACTSQDRADYDGVSVRGYIREHYGEKSSRAVEEIVVELSTMLLLVASGEGYEPVVHTTDDGSNSKAYISSWMKSLSAQERSGAIMTAVTAAISVADGITKELRDVSNK